MSIDTDQLEQIKKTVESMDKFHQIEVLKIFSKNLCKINENKSGCYINLSFVGTDTIDEINEYIKYINRQEYSLNVTEKQKEDFKNAYFIEKDNKEEMTLVYN
jgi:ACT domain-containing protein